MAQEPFACPCCGHRGLGEPAYAALPEPPFGDLGAPPYVGRFGYASFECCACCGFEFGYDDDAGASGQACSFADYLARFVAQGCRWFCPDQRPAAWSLTEQLRAAGIPGHGPG